MEKMSDIIRNRETFCKLFYLFLILSLYTEQRNLSGFTSVSPKARFFSSNNPSKNKRSSKKSLNFDRRLRDHKMIVEQNEAMLKRLQAKKSHFNVASWNKEEQSRKKVLKNIKLYHKD